ncbi:MAG: GNAT family N-acetyltransferase [Novosphingobium sp.]
MIETERLVLRPPAADDLPWLLEAMNTLAVLRHLGGAIRSPDEVAEGLDADIAAFGSGGHRRWTVWLRDGAERIGRCGLFRIRSTDAPPALRGQDEIGWTFAEPFWGQGYASEAARAVTAHFFADKARDLLWAQTSDSNAGSTRMMARLGFARCAQLDYVDPGYPPQDNPTTVYRMTRGDWAAAA